MYNEPLPPRWEQKIISKAARIRGRILASRAANAPDTRLTFERRGLVQANPSTYGAVSRAATLEQRLVTLFAD